jgi:ferredoxin-NADP reductase
MSNPQPLVYEATIERLAELAPDTRAFFLRLPAEQRLMFRPGQFISCLLPIGGREMIRPYSIASDPEQPDRLEICLNLVPGGPGSHYLFSLHVGASVRFTGPWGTFTLEQQPDAECVFIAAGPGIAPIRPMLRRALASRTAHSVQLHYAASSREFLLYARELDESARRHARFTWEPVLENALGERIARRYIAGDRDRSRHFYICGVGDIVPQLRDLLRRAGYARRSVQYEKW